MTQTDLIIADLPSMPLSERNYLPNCPAVYFVVAADKVVYIGRSRRLVFRWQGFHHRHLEFQAMPNLQISWLALPECELEATEAALIKRFHPELNGHSARLKRQRARAGKA